MSDTVFPGLNDISLYVIKDKGLNKRVRIALEYGVEYLGHDVGAGAHVFRKPGTEHEFLRLNNAQLMVRIPAFRKLIQAFLENKQPHENNPSTCKPLNLLSQRV